jgi:hypothetical protein
MSFVKLQLTFAGSVVIVTSIFPVISPHRAPLTNSLPRAVVIGGLLVVLFGTVLLHLGRGIEVARSDGGVTGPNLCCMQSYAGVGSFIYLLQLIVSVAVSISFVFALIAPVVFGSFGSSRSGTLALLLDLVDVMLASGYIPPGPLVAWPDGRPDPPATDRGARRPGRRRQGWAVPPWGSDCAEVNRLGRPRRSRCPRSGRWPDRRGPRT